MKDILVVAACLGLVLIVLRVVVAWLERVKSGRATGREAGEEKKRGGPDGLITAIIAGIAAYEEGVGVGERKRKRRVYKRRVEEASWWRTKERMKQTQRRG